MRPSVRDAGESKDSAHFTGTCPLTWGIRCDCNPTIQPSNHPTIQPSNHPTIQPSNHPSIRRAIQPSSYPTNTSIPQSLITLSFLGATEKGGHCCTVLTITMCASSLRRSCCFASACGSGQEASGSSHHDSSAFDVPVAVGSAVQRLLPPQAANYACRRTHPRLADPRPCTWIRAVGLHSRCTQLLKPLCTVPTSLPLKSPLKALENRGSLVNIRLCSRIRFTPGHVMNTLNHKRGVRM